MLTHYADFIGFFFFLTAHFKGVKSINIAESGSVQSGVYILCLTREKNEIRREAETLNGESELAHLRSRVVTGHTLVKALVSQSY